MIFKGISRSFSTKNDSQYNSIGEFFDKMSSVFGRENLRGLGYNWTESKIEYVIGLKDNSNLLDNNSKTANENNKTDEIFEIFPDAKYKEVLIADTGWKDYNGTTNELSSLYDEIYADGNLTYEIEEFYLDGSCKIHITRDLPELICFMENDLASVMTLYNEAIGSEGCVWNDLYPTEDLILNDIKQGNLFGIKDSSGEIIASIAIDDDKVVENLKCWSNELKPSAELARLVISQKYKNQGLARILIMQMTKILKLQGYKSAHFLAAVQNKPAMHSYDALPFNKVGETILFEAEYLCYEKEL